VYIDFDIRLDCSEKLIRAKAGLIIVHKNPAVVELIEFSRSKSLTMESLVRFLIGFVLIYQLLPMADCKVIKQRSVHEKQISESEVNYEWSDGRAQFNSTLNNSQVDLNETSINYTNATLSSESDITHM
jgi:hypothetical protein